MGAGAEHVHVRGKVTVMEWRDLDVAFADLAELVERGMGWSSKTL